MRQEGKGMSVQINRMQWNNECQRCEKGKRRKQARACRPGQRPKAVSRQRQAPVHPLNKGIRNNGIIIKETKEETENGGRIRMI